MRFVVRALDAERRLVATEVEAGDEAAARELARDRGYKVLSLAPRNGLLAAFRQRNAFPTALFSIELLALLERLERTD